MTKRKTWGTISIGLVAKVLPGYAFRSRDFAKEGFPVVKIKNIRSDCTICMNDVDCIPLELISKKYDTYILHDGAMLIAMTGATAGKVGKLRSDTPVLLNQRVAQFKPFNIDEHFFWSVVSSQIYQDVFYRLADGAAQPNMSGKQIESVLIPFPPLPTQRRIASILSTYDDLIENNTRRIAILEEMARRLYEEWFVNFRFPGHETVRFVETELGPVPEGWEVEKLGSIAVLNPESIKLSSAPNTIKYIDISSVSTGKISQVTPMLFVDAPSRARRIVKSTDILWSCVRPNLRAYALIINPAPDTVVSTGFAVIRAQNAPYSYIYSLVTSDVFVSYLVNHATGVAYPSVKPSDFEAARILLPHKRFLNEFHENIEPMLLLCAELKQKNANLRAQRDLLLPKLISGELDVSEVEDLIEEADV